MLFKKILKFSRCAGTLLQHSYDCMVNKNCIKREILAEDRCEDTIIMGRDKEYWHQICFANLPRNQLSVDITFVLIQLYLVIVDIFGSEKVNA